MRKLYVVVRQDIEPGLVAAQAVHAAVAFALKYPSQTAAWNLGENNVAVLGARDEAHLNELLSKLPGGVLMVDFREPDLHGQRTAFAVDCRARKVFASLPCALKAHRLCITDREAAE